MTPGPDTDFQSRVYSCLRSVLPLIFSANNSWGVILSKDLLDQGTSLDQH